MVALQGAPWWRCKDSYLEDPPHAHGLNQAVAERHGALLLLCLPGERGEAGGLEERKGGWGPPSGAHRT